MNGKYDDSATKAGTTKDVARSRGKTFGETVSGAKGEFIEQGEISGLQGYISLDSRFSRRGGGDRIGNSGNSDLGKILEAVKLIEEKHISYVKAHQKHLAARLDESRESESDFRQSIQKLEAQILELMSRENIKDTE